MSKLYVNGYDAPIFRLVDKITSAEEIIEMSFKYQALKEYYEKVSTLLVYDDGSKEKIIHYYNYEWHLSYIQSIENPDMMKLKQIENAEATHYIFLKPHKEIFWREFQVLILDEKSEIDLHYHHGGADSTTNKGYNKVFVNAEPITECQTVDPNFIPVNAATVGEEF